MSCCVEEMGIVINPDYFTKVLELKKEGKSHTHYHGHNLKPTPTNAIYHKNKKGTLSNEFTPFNNESFPKAVINVGAF